MKSNIETLFHSLIFMTLSLLLCGFIFHLLDYPALITYQSIIDSAFFRNDSLTHLLRWSFPLLISACGVLLSFRAGFFNIGIQGQFYLGAIFAAFAAHILNGFTPFLVIPISMFAGMAGGALWALWPGYLRVRFQTDEVITTLMGNFIAALLLSYVTTGPLKNPAGSGQQSSSAPLDIIYRISDSYGVSWSIFSITVAVVLLTWLLINRTSYGVISGLTGRNPEMVRWQGGNIWKIGLTSFAISGALAGLAGFVEVFGANGRLIGGMLPAQGFTAILIALVANLSVLGAILSSLLFGGMASAALYLPIMVGLPAAAVSIINSSIALFITSQWTAFRNLFSGSGKTT